MPAETTLRPASTTAVSAVQLVRRRAFGKIVRVDLAPAADRILPAEPQRPADRLDVVA